MTDDELKALVASISVGIKELTESQKKTDLKFRELAELRRKAQEKMDRRFWKTDQRFLKTDQRFLKADQWFQEMRESQKETDRQIQATDRQLQATDRQLQATELQLQKTARKLDSIGEMVGGISNNQGDVAEEFFIRGFQQTMTLDNLHFDRLLKYYSIGHKRLTDEFDIVLVNGKIVVVIEVKYKVHQNDIKKMIEKKLPNFRTLASTYNNHKLYGAIAGFSIPDDVIKEADQAGLFVLGRSGTNMTLLANHPLPQA
jgi:hypothetical protein